MRKIAVIALSFVLGAAMLTGCRRGSSTDMTTMPTESTHQTGSTIPGESGARGRIGANRTHMIQNGNIACRTDLQCN